MINLHYFRTYGNTKTGVIRMISYWLRDSQKSAYPKMSGISSADIVIVGGGISGISLAYELSFTKKRIILLEQNELYHSTTGYTTGKLTCQHGDLYQKLLKKSEPAARAYYQAQKKALLHLQDIIQKHRIACDYTPCDHILFGKKGSAILRREARAYRALQIPFSEDSFRSFSALRIKDQATFHIVRYLDGLLAYLNTCENVCIFEHSQVLKTSKSTVIGSGFEIAADQIIFCSWYPADKRFNFYFTELRPVTSFVAVGKTKHPIRLSGIRTDDPVLSFRPLDASRMLFAGFSAPAEALTKYRCIDTFEKSIRELFPDIQIESAWYNEDYQTLDDLPYIGAIRKNIYLATGFNKWGISGSVAASMILKDLLLKGTSPYASVVSPKRPLPFSRRLSYCGKNLLLWFKTKYQYQGKTCTHLGCRLRKNTIAGTWDCPCHGSRFTPMGHVITGPAKKDIQ